VREPAVHYTTVPRRNPGPWRSFGSQIPVPVVSWVSKSPPVLRTSPLNFARICIYAGFVPFPFFLTEHESACAENQPNILCPGGYDEELNAIISRDDVRGCRWRQRNRMPPVCHDSCVSWAALHTRRHKISFCEPLNPWVWTDKGSRSSG